MSSRGRLARFKKRIDDLTVNMQKFCLNPSKKLFDEICACDSIRRNESEEFETWRLAVLYKWGGQWDMELDPDTKLDIGLSHIKFLAIEKGLVDNLIETPSRSKALKLLHIFFATGELRYIEFFYQCMGHEGLVLSTRRNLCEIYIKIKELYTATVPILLQEDPEHFDKIGVEKSDVDFTYFEKFKDQLGKHREDRNAKTEFKNLDKPRPIFPAAIYGITKKDT